MKRIICLLLAAVLALLTASAGAEIALNNRRLTNKALLKPIKASGYADWTLYQPEDREIAVDVTKVKAFKKYAYFPVLAVKGDETAILLLRRTAKGWQLDGDNRTALTRPGCTLAQFTMDHMFDGVNEAMLIGFFFTLEDGGTMELFLEPMAGSRHFSGISYLPPERVAENLFADYVSIRFNSGLAYGYTTRMTGNNWQYCMDSPLPLAKEYDNFDVFDLAQVPMTIMEALSPATLAQDTQLRQYPGESAVLAQLHAGDEVLVPFAYGSIDWVPAWVSGAMGYVPGDSLVQGER